MFKQVLPLRDSVGEGYCKLPSHMSDTTRTWTTTTLQSEGGRVNRAPQM